MPFNINPILQGLGPVPQSPRILHPDQKGKPGHLSPDYQAWFQSVYRVTAPLAQTGLTANRPTKNLYIGQVFFDGTLGHPIWYNGTNWVTATGALA